MSKKLIGEGSYSKVFKGHEINNKNFVVAIKELDINKCDGKFQDEIRITKSISHQNVIKIFDNVTIMSKCYIILEFCQNNLMEINHQISRS
jgi:serine/threonine protein kinase